MWVSHELIARAQATDRRSANRQCGQKKETTGMKSGLIAATVAAACLAAAGAVNVPATMAATTPTRVDNFQLTDHTRFAHDLHYYKYAPAIVLMSQTNGTTVSRNAAAELHNIAASREDVKFFMINSNLNQTREQAAAEAAAQGFTIPVLLDEYQLVGESLGIEREGEVFVINPDDWSVAYRGPVSGAAAAIDAVVAGRDVANARIDVATGAAIDFPLRGADLTQISYAEDVAPVLDEKCGSCHITGGIGPFALDSYETVQGYAPMIRETLRTKRMPPYFPDPHIGEFQNDQGLTADETKLLVHWIEAGAPRGTGADPLLANADKVAPDWPEDLGPPDIVVDLPAFEVAATGIIEYQNFVVDNPFQEDAWLRAIAIKPGDRRVLHHVTSGHSPDRSLPSSGIPGGSVGSYTPGARPQVIADGAGAPVPAGGQLRFNMHYTTVGVATTDTTQVGFYVHDEEPQFIKRSMVIGDSTFVIPAGEQRFREVSYVTFPADAYLYTLYPHAHYRGRHVELKAIEPDGTEKMLISLPKYDFNWQRDYDPVEPIFIEAGTKLVAMWEWDNSVHNWANPDPTQDVRSGDQTHEEMMYFRVNYRFADETTDNVRNDLQAALSENRTMGRLDNNVDGLIQVSELRGRDVDSIRGSFAVLDRDGNGGLDADEYAAASESSGAGFARGGRTPQDDVIAQQAADNELDEHGL
jgi:hypothetical protein